MNQLPLAQQVRIISLLVEGNSIRSIERLTGRHRDTIMRLGARIGQACQRLHHARMRNLQVSCLELDETWSFVRKKQRNLQTGDPAEFGDTYLWVALDVHTKLIVSYLVGKRDGEHAMTFLDDVHRRIINRPQITTDAFPPYEDAVYAAFGSDVDYVMMNKTEGEYATRIGDPNLDQVTTNRVERFNLTVRTQLRRHTRRASGHSKKLDNHRAAIALLVAHYNWCRVHESLSVTPAMEFGLARQIWSVEELIEQALVAPPLPPPLLPPPPRRRGPRTFQVVQGGRRG